MSIFGSVKDKITQYVEVYIKLLKVNFIGKTASILSYFMFAMICLFLLFGIIMLIGFGVVEVFVALGFTKVAAFFLTTGVFTIKLVILLSLRRPITRFFANTFISVITEGDDEDSSDKD